MEEFKHKKVKAAHICVPIDTFMYVLVMFSLWIKVYFWAMTTSSLRTVKAIKLS